MKGQSSIEFLFMVAVFLVIVASFTIPHMINPARDTSDRTLSMGKTRTACDQLANSINGISKSGDNSVDSLGVSIPQKWDLELQTDPPHLNMTIYLEGKSVEVKNRLDYGFTASKSGLPPGYYTLIVEKTDEDKLVRAENKITISLNPGE